VPFVDRLISVGVLPEPSYVEPVEEEADEFGEQYDEDGNLVGQSEEQYDEDGNPIGLTVEEVYDEDGNLASEDSGEEVDQGDLGGDEKESEGDEEDRTPAGLTKNEFNETEHPRADDGKFGNKSGIPGDSLEDPPRPYKVNDDALKTQKSATAEFRRALKSQYRITIPLYHEAPIEALDSILKSGLTSDESAEDTNFATIGKPSGFITSRDKVLVKFSIRHRALDKLVPDMRYDPANPSADLLREHGGVFGADVGYTDRVLLGEIDYVKVIKGGKVTATYQYPFKSPAGLTKNRRSIIIHNAAGEQVGVKTKTGYSVVWPDLDSNTDLGKAQVAATKVQAMATYVSGNVESVMPLMDFYTKILGMTDEEAKDLVKSAEEMQVQQQMDQQQQQMMGDDPTMGGQGQFGEEPQFGQEDMPEQEDGGQFQQNAFCPTGEGNGVDPTCSPGDKSSHNYEGKHTVNGVEYDSADGIGQTGDNMNIDYMGHVSYMKPGQFLRLNPDRERGRTPYLDQAVAEGRPIGPPTLYGDYDESTGTITVTGHEGRGRAMAIQKLDPQIEMPVHVILRKKSTKGSSGEMRSRSLTPEIIQSLILPDERADKDYRQSFQPHHVVLKGFGELHRPSEGLQQ
jgi:hypothetical protein